MEYQISKKIDSQIMNQTPVSKIVKTIKEEFGKGMSTTQAKKILEEIVVQTVTGDINQKGGRVSLPQVYFNPEDIRGGSRKTRKNKNKKQNQDKKDKKQKRQQRGGTFGGVSDNTIPGGGGSDAADLAGPHAAEQGVSHLTFADSPPSNIQQGIDLMTGKTPILTPTRSDTTHPDLEFHGNKSGDVLKPDASSEAPMTSAEDFVNKTRLEGVGSPIENTDVNFKNIAVENKVEWDNALQKEFVTPYGIRYTGQGGGRRNNRKNNKKSQKQNRKNRQNKNQNRQNKKSRQNRKNRRQNGGMGGASSDWKSTLYSRGPINTPEMTANNTPSFTADSPHMSKSQLLEDLGVNRIKNEEVAEINGSNQKSGVSSVHYGGRKKILS